MHRSGTSALTGLLGIHGVPLGDNLMPPGEDNPKGFWEAADIVSLQNHWLEAMGSRWDDVGPLPESWFHAGPGRAAAEQLAQQLTERFGDQPLFAVKDPRSSRLLPLWEQALARCDRQPLAVICLRHPLAVAGSLAARNGMPTGEAVLLWLRYMLDAEHDSRHWPRLVLDYDQLLVDRVGSLARLEQQLPLTLPLQGRDQQEAAAAFLEPGLRHHRPQWDLDQRPDLVDWCQQAWDWFRQAAEADRCPDPSPLDRIRQELDAADQAYRPLWQHRQQLWQTTDQQLHQANLRIRELEQQYQEYQVLQTAHGELAQRLQHLEQDHGDLSSRHRELENRAASLQHELNLQEFALAEAAGELQAIKASRLWRWRDRSRRVRRVLGLLRD